ncbi:MAG TPA: ACT domain-containing protein, partial [Chroococcales cyanobacterium]
LSALSYNRFARPAQIYKEGIRKISAEDMAQAKELGYRIKLVGSTSLSHDGQIDVRVHPTMVPLGHPLASVSGSNNGILVSGDAVGEIVLVGPGAGMMPTASAIVGDTINLASALQLPDFASYFQPKIDTEWASVSDPGEKTCPYYVRLAVSDTPGVIGRIGTIFGEHQISIQSILQKGVHSSGAKIVILTQAVKNENMEKALGELKKCDFLTELESVIRIYQPPVKHA